MRRWVYKMQRISKWIFTVIINVVVTIFLSSCGNESPKVAITFDDGSTANMPGYKNSVWNQMILDKLAEVNLKSIFFIKGRNLDNKLGKSIIISWNDQEHIIANHTYNHPYFNSKKLTTADFKYELLKNDSLIRDYSNFKPYFRFPYLKEGNSKEKIEGFRQILEKYNYRNGHVSIDASDWYVNSRMVDKLKSHSLADIEPYKDFYLKHILNRAEFYDSLSTLLTGRKIKHVLLLHHNLAAALFLDDLIEKFESEGWEVIDAAEAYEDEIYNREPNIVPAGESLIWALAKESGKFEEVLRYPGEDSRYEKEKMDELGL